MQFTDICLLTEDVSHLAHFYEELLHVKSYGDDVHANLTLGAFELNLYALRAAQDDMKFDFSTYCGTGKLTVGFQVKDVDAEYERLKALGVHFVTQPKTYPWGARSVHFRDPDGNIVCFRSVAKE